MCQEHVKRHCKCDQRTGPTEPGTPRRRGGNGRILT